nr:protein LAZ1 homolog 1 [Ipomoea batatas]
MGWKGVFFILFSLTSLVQSSSGRVGNFWTLNASSGSASLYSWAICSAGIFVLVALVLSMYLIFEHLSSYNQPEEQKFLIGLILMVPVYALESFLSLLDSKAAFNYEVIRDCYEALKLLRYTALRGIS